MSLRDQIVGKLEGGLEISLNVKIVVDERFAQRQLIGSEQHPPQAPGCFSTKVKRGLFVLPQISPFQKRTGKIAARVIGGDGIKQLNGDFDRMVLERMWQVLTCNSSSGNEPIAVSCGAGRGTDEISPCSAKFDQAQEQL